MSSLTKCPKCLGKGNILIKHRSKCPTCRGMGSTKLIIGGAKPTGKNTCKKCDGSGQIVNEVEKENLN